MLSVLVLALGCDVGAYFLPLDHPVYESLDYLVGQNLLPGLNGNAKPYEAEKAIAGLMALDSSPLSRAQKDNLKEAMDYLGLFLKKKKDENALLLEVYLTENSVVDDSLSYRTRVGGGVAYSFGRFSLADRVTADLTNQKNRYDHLDRQFKASLPSDMPQAYLAYSGDRFGVLLGRNACKWGPGKYGNLMLGDHQQSMNMLSGWAHIGFLDGYTLSAKLNSIGDYNRYLSASRVVIKINRNINVALNQSVVYSGFRRNFEAYYVLPSYIYYFSQFGFTDNNYTENTFVGADGEWRINDKCRLYFEFLADDFQVDRDITSRTTQNAVAWMIGAECPSFYGSWSGGMEFTHINSYVYKHMGGLPTHYIANDHGGVIGHPLGPDAEELDLWINNRFSRYFKGELHYSLTRKGDLNNIFGSWDGYGKASAAIPHGRVQHAHDLSIDAGLVNYKGFSANGAIGYLKVVNKDNQDASASSPWFRLKAAYYFGYLLQWNTRETLLPTE